MADHDLTTTAVTPTSVTIATLRDRLRQELHDESDDRWTDDVLDRHLVRAVRELSLYAPREQKATLTTTADSRELSLGTLADLVRVEAVEYPVDRYPPEYVKFSVYAGTMTLLVDAAPTSAVSVYVYWGKVHTLSSGESTLETRHEDLVVLGAGGYAATEWANYAVNRANLAGTEAFEQYRSWGRDALRRFRAQLRDLAETSQLRTSDTYTPARSVGSRNIVSEIS